MALAARRPRRERSAIALLAEIRPALDTSTARRHRRSSEDSLHESRKEPPRFAKSAADAKLKLKKD